MIFPIWVRMTHITGTNAADAMRSAKKSHTAAVPPLVRQRRSARSADGNTAKKVTTSITQLGQQTILIIGMPARSAAQKRTMPRTAAARQLVRKRKSAISAVKNTAIFLLITTARNINITIHSTGKYA